MNKDRLDKLCKVMHKAREIEDIFNDFCNKNNCDECFVSRNAPKESCRDYLFTHPERVLPAIYPKSFGEEVLEAFPDFNFNDACCVQSFFKGKLIRDDACDSYESCEQHYMTRTREQILKEMEE